MFVPSEFALSDRRAIADLLRDHPFALLITQGPEGLQATHLPLLHDWSEDGELRLLGHLARANPQRLALERLAREDGEALAVFQGPHAYVSPSWYGPGAAVPTWNYLAVHAYGRLEPLGRPERARALLERMVAAFEADRAEPWSLSGQDEAYVTRMMRGIYAFELTVGRLESKAKLSQNRDPRQRSGVLAALAAGPEAGSREVAAWMRRLVAVLPPG